MKNWAVIAAIACVISVSVGAVLAGSVSNRQADDARARDFETQVEQVYQDCLVVNGDLKLLQRQSDKMIEDMAKLATTFDHLGDERAGDYFRDRSIQLASQQIMLLPCVTRRDASLDRGP